MALKLDLNYNVIRAQLIRAIQFSTGLNPNNTIVMEQEAPGSKRPSLPYMGMKIINPGRRFGDDTQQNISTGMPAVSSEVWSSGGPRGMTVSFHSFAESHEDAYNLMSLWQTSLDEPTTQSLLRQAGIAVWLIGSVEDLSQLLNTAYEGRAHMDCEFGIAMNVTSNLGEMDSVTVDGQITTDQGQIQDISVTVSSED